MSAMPQLPTGETLPQYEDQHPEGVDVRALYAWLIQHRPNVWLYPDGEHVTAIRDVLAALQAVGDATLVKNGTYRAMRRDGADIERLAARLSNTHTELLVQHGGNPVSTVLAILGALDVKAPAPVQWPT